MSRSATALATVVFCLASWWAWAEPVELPLSADLTAKRIAVDLRGGRVEVSIDPYATPQLKVTDLNQSSNDEGYVHLEQSENGLVVGQLLGGEKIAPPLLVRLVVPPDVAVSLSGDHLQISIERIAAPRRALAGALPGSSDSGDSPDPRDADADSSPGAESRTPGGAASAGASPLIRIDARNSVVRVVGAGASLKGLETHFEVVRGSGVLFAALTGGDLQVHGFAGLLDLSGVRAEINLSGAAGAVKFKLDGGGLKLADGAGAVSGSAARASITADRWRGALDLRGEDAQVELHDVHTDGGTVVLAGPRTDFLVEQIGGDVSAELENSQLTLNQAAGSAVVRAGLDSEVSITGVSGDAEVTLTGESRAQVRGVERTLRADVEYSALDAENFGGLHLTAARSKVNGRRIAGRVDVMAADSDLELDLVGASSHPSFDLSGSTTARITLPSPCLVRVEGDLAATADRLTVAGCELQQASRVQPAPPRRDESAGPLVASAKLDDAAVLRVRHGS